MAALFAFAGRGMEGNVDRDTTVERYRGEILIEERLKHDDLIALFEKSDEDRVLAWRPAMSVRREAR